MHPVVADLNPALGAQVRRDCPVTPPLFAQLSDFGFMVA
ncbi:MAG: hypothetical protein BWX86_01097 [Verrucomicrobia bacterium ADurb.Bin122]|nr:MAG: hypothetical protein BWX86_01097 [Verrucomicrobia bacterium ADurb.Bin122]